VDIGGVLLTNGWDHHARRGAARHFKLDWAEMEELHALTFEVKPGGLLPEAPLNEAQFRRFMCDQSRPYSDLLGMFAH
jgi:putative hydrolase of the HAD superfamily